MVRLQYALFEEINANGAEVHGFSRTNSNNSGRMVNITGRQRSGEPFIVVQTIRDNDGQVYQKAYKMDEAYVQKILLSNSNSLFKSLEDVVDASPSKAKKTVSKAKKTSTKGKKAASPSKAKKTVSKAKKTSTKGKKAASPSKAKKTVSKVKKAASPSKAKKTVSKVKKTATKAKKTPTKAKKTTKK